jgi:hypothetical protein
VAAIAAAAGGEPAASRDNVAALGDAAAAPRDTGVAG